MHIQIRIIMQKGICILHTQAHTLYDNKSETNQPHGLFINILCNTAKTLWQPFSVVNTVEPASLVLLTELVWYCSKFA